MDGIPNGSDISGPMSISLNSTFNLLMTKRESYNIHIVITFD